MPKAAKDSPRSFGVSVGLVLCALGLLSWWRSRPVGAEAVSVPGLLLLVCGVVSPAVLAWPAARWFRFSRALGRVNAQILLTIVFAAVFVPMALLWRLTGKDPLA